MRYVGKLLIVSLFTMVALFATAMIGVAPVLAAPGNGATVINASYCSVDEGFTTCTTAKGVMHQVNTPSGNASYTAEGRSTSVVTDPSGALVYESSVEFHLHNMNQGDMEHELSDRFNQTLAGFNGVTCTIEYAVHLVDGKIQFERSEERCS